MGLLHPDNRDYTTTSGAPVASGAMPAQGGNHFTGGTHHHNHAGVNPATHIPATQTAATGPAPNTAGPHRHDILNRLDPKVDSDLSKTAEAHNNSMLNPGAGYTGHTSHTGAGHHVNPAMAAGVGAVGGAGMAHHHNHHGKNATGAAVPMTAAGGMTAASGPAPNTAGPHKSDLANRLDPTVDSRTGLRK
ncbi:hypothetical protein SEUCBS139899_002595 [Sporothrix eucalyptigena]|uniref:Uncharacterized protein n=1 Tax=Sporothrix eucalyptigena TaxID=1812306 RepID=A0ABP0BL30_9PEZI